MYTENSEKCEKQIIHNWEEYQSQEEKIKKAEVQSGPLLLSTSLIKEMRHEPIFASAIFNPFGPTIETLSISEFQDPPYQSILLRRSFHPFSKVLNQTCTLIPIIDVITKETLQSQYNFITSMILLFIGNNATSQNSRSWAKRLTSTVPSGVLAHDLQFYLDGVKLGFAHLLQNAGDQLKQEIKRIHQYGTDLWTSTKLDFSLTADKNNYLETELDFPSITNVHSIITNEPGIIYLQWWELIHSEEYQKEIHTSIGEAWYGAVNQFFGGKILRAMGAENGDTDHDEDFFAWWKLFDPTRYQ